MCVCQEDDEFECLERQRAMDLAFANQRRKVTLHGCTMEDQTRSKIEERIAVEDDEMFQKLFDAYRQQTTCPPTTEYLNIHKLAPAPSEYDAAGNYIPRARRAEPQERYNYRTQRDEFMSEWRQRQQTL